jgi:hypothetical protein
MTKKPLASLSLDLDNKWSYLKTHGHKSWASFPTYLPVVVPRVLRFLKERGLTITFFVVGQDAARDENHEAIASLAAAGHEIGNHSFHHEPWLHLYSEEEINAELERAEESIERVTGIRTQAFRGPGYSLSAAVLRVLHRRSYRFDASTFPTYLGPLARAYYFMTAKLDEEEKKRRSILFGTMKDGLRPVKPFRWQLEVGSVLEIPVTTMPGLKTPIHFSYLVYLSTFSRRLARSYFGNALRLCRLTCTQPSLLLHPLDVLGGDDTSDLGFFPGMRLPHERKLEIMSDLVGLLTERFGVLPMGQFADRLDDSVLPVREPRFAPVAFPRAAAESAPETVEAS